MKGPHMRLGKKPAEAEEGRRAMPLARKVAMYELFHVLLTAL